MCLVLSHTGSHLLLRITLERIVTSILQVRKLSLSLPSESLNFSLSNTTSCTEFPYLIQPKFLARWYKYYQHDILLKKLNDSTRSKQEVR